MSSRFSQYTYDITDLNGIEVFSEFTRSLGLLLLGFGVGVAFIGEALIAQFCLRSVTMGAPGLVGDGCAVAQHHVESYFMKGLAAGMALVVIGVVTDILWRND